MSKGIIAAKGDKWKVTFLQGDLNTERGVSLRRIAKGDLRRQELTGNSEVAISLIVRRPQYAQGLILRVVPTHKRDVRGKDAVTFSWKQPSSGKRTGLERFFVLFNMRYTKG